MGRKIAKEIEEKVVIGYQEGKGTMELSKEFNIHRATVQKILQRNNIKLRKRTPENKYNIHFLIIFLKKVAIGQVLLLRMVIFVQTGIL